MTIPTPVPTPTRTRAERQRQRREEQRRREREQAVAELARREETDEQLAPAIRRHAIMDASGELYRAPTVRRDGVSFVRSSSISHLVSSGGATYAHEKAAERLCRAWEDGGRGVGTASGGYGERTSSLPQTGWISDQVLAAIGYQTRCKTEYAAAQTWLGALFHAVQRVVLDGIDIAAWGRETGRNPQAAKGYVIASLDRLEEFYRTLDASKERPPVVVPIRSAEVVSKARQ